MKGEMMTRRISATGPHKPVTGLGRSPAGSFGCCTLHSGTHLEAVDIQGGDYKSLATGAVDMFNIWHEEMLVTPAPLFAPGQRKIVQPAIPDHSLTVLLPLRRWENGEDCNLVLWKLFYFATHLTPRVRVVIDVTQGRQYCPYTNGQYRSVSQHHISRGMKRDGII